MSNAPILTAFFEFTKNVHLPFFQTETENPVLSLNYLPKNPLIKKEDFICLGYEPEYKSNYFIWNINPNENLDNQPIVFAWEYNFTPIGVVAPNLSTFLGMLAYPQSMRFGLKKAYEYLWKKEKNQPFDAPTGILDWEVAQYQTRDTDNNQNNTSNFLKFLEVQNISLCADIYHAVLEAMGKFPLLDSYDFIHQLSKNFPNMEMPTLVRDFYVLVDKYNISLPEFEDDRGNHITQSGIIPHFVSADVAHYFIKIGLTGSGGYYAIWLIFPDKKIEENPILLLDSEASPLAVVACNFQEYLRIAHTNIYNFISDIERDEQRGREIEDVDDTIIQEHLEQFKEDNQADEYENLPERTSLWFDFVEENTPNVQEKNPFQIIKNAYLTMPNLLNWLKEKMPDMYNW